MLNIPRMALEQMRHVTYNARLETKKRVPLSICRGLHTYSLVNKTAVVLRKVCSGLCSVAHPTPVKPGGDFKIMCAMLPVELKLPGA